MIKCAFSNFANVRGRASRFESWWFCLFMAVVSGALYDFSMSGIASSPDPQLWNLLAQGGICRAICGARPRGGGVPLDRHEFSFRALTSWDTLPKGARLGP